MTETPRPDPRRRPRSTTLTLALLLLAASVLLPAVSAESQGACVDDGCCHRRTDVTWARCQVVGTWIDSNEVYWAEFDEGNDPDDDAPWD